MLIYVQVALHLLMLCLEDVLDTTSVLVALESGFFVADGHILT